MTPVFGVVACMLAYFEADRGPEVLTYLPKKEGYYFYLTRRRSPEGALVCVGGPERKLAEEERFEHRNDLVPGGREEIQHFLLANLPEYEAREDHPFFWSGLMGYNQTGIRLAGPHPAEPRLLLDLGCNGIGILPSLAASRRIAAHLRGESPSPSLFDPGTQARPQ
jgi:glycine/D-amino acid oxidase-like deaminating enzyme